MNGADLLREWVPRQQLHFLRKSNDPLAPVPDYVDPEAGLYLDLVPWSRPKVISLPQQDHVVVHSHLSIHISGACQVAKVGRLEKKQEARVRASPNATDGFVVGLAVHLGTLWPLDQRA